MVTKCVQKLPPIQLQSTRLDAIVVMMSMQYSNEYCGRKSDTR